MTPPPWTDLLYANLGWGKDRVRSLGDLAESMQAPRRALEQATSDLRKSGAPIISCSQGLYLTTSPAELRAAYRSLRARYIHQAVGARVLLRTAARYEKYQNLTLWSDVA